MVDRPGGKWRDGRRALYDGIAIGPSDVLVLDLRRPDPVSDTDVLGVGHIDCIVVPTGSQCHGLIAIRPVLGPVDVEHQITIREGGDDEFTLVLAFRNVPRTIRAQQIEGQSGQHCRAGFDYLDRRRHRLF